MVQSLADVNTSVKNFYTYAIPTNNAITDQEFKDIFWQDSTPFIIEKCCDFTQKLRTIAEKEWIPVLYLTQDICKKHDAQVDVTKPTGQYYKALTAIDIQYRRIAQTLSGL